MKRETLIWMIIFIVAGLFLVVRTATTGMGRAYVQAEPHRFVEIGAGEDAEWVNFDEPGILDHEIAGSTWEGIPEDRRIDWMQYHQANRADFLEAEAASPGVHRFRVSIWRTLGIWVAAFFTLAIFSFLYRDNPLYKIAESVVVGVSAAYWMVVGFWEVIVPNLIGKIIPALVKAWAMPGLEAGWEWSYLIPFVLGIMLLWRLMPVGGWISRWPLAFIIGTTAGIRLIGFIQADFLSQIRNSIVPLVVQTGGIDTLWDSLRNVILVIGVLSCLVYFFFSFEHKGAIGATARLGIWFLMVTFGAAFGYTVMGRIALLAIRLEFLADDWLWLIDPTGKRAVEAAVGLLSGLGFG